MSTLSGTHRLNRCTHLNRNRCNRVLNRANLFLHPKDRRQPRQRNHRCRRLYLQYHLHSRPHQRRFDCSRRNQECFVGRDRHSPLMVYMPKSCSIRLHRKLCRCHHQHPLGYLGIHPHRSPLRSMRSIPSHLLSKGRRHQRHHRCRRLCLPSHLDNHPHHDRSALLRSNRVVPECIDRQCRESSRYHRHHRRRHP